MEREINILPLIISTFFGSCRRLLCAQWLLIVAFYAIFANIPFWVASHWLLLLPLGWFCAEYALVGLLALFAPRILSAALLLFVIAADLTSAVSKTYYLAPTECLVNIGSLHEFPGARLLVVAAIVVLVLLITSIAAFFPVEAIRRTYRSRTAACLVALAVLAVSADCIAVVRETGHIPNPFGMERLSDANKFSDFKNLWICRYPAIRLVLNERLLGGKSNAMSVFQTDRSPVQSAAALAVRYASLAAGRGTQKMPNVVLILVESWGLGLDSSIRSSLVGPYAQPGLLARYKVLQGSVPFYGSTVAGEARELCGNKIGFHILNISAQESQDCLPDLFVSLGYHSLALHGMDGRMFNRLTWYSRIGFQEQWFRDQFRQEGLPDCVGAFVGICDADIAEWIGRRLGKEDATPDFIHWTTLNSHLPVPIPSGLPAGASCSLTSLLAQQSALCSWYQLVSNVHVSVSKMAMSHLARQTVFVIVGDHAPPFANPALRRQFSNTEVPYVVLIPRLGNCIADR
ncbi:MAG: sulfatase-like hydrolase/transferase [Terracidiphilus sp.]